MQKIGAPAALRTSEEALRRFREHAARIKAFPYLLSANRKGASCNPGESVFLLYLLISNSGVLSEQDLESAQTETRMGSPEIEHSFGVAHTVFLGSSAGMLVSSYVSHHSANETVALGKI